MAILIVDPSVSFDYFNIDLNWFAKNFTSSSSNGSVLTINASDVSETLTLSLEGQGLAVSGSAITAGTVGSITEMSGSLALWSLYDISVDAVSIYNASLTPSNSDDLALISTTLSGSDLITLSDQADHMNGFGGNDTILARAGNDSIEGGDGNDLLDGGSGADTLDGGAGTDAASYLSSQAGLTASLANPAANTGDAAGDVYISIEGLVGSSFNDTLTGDGQSNVLIGGDGNDLINGGAGADLLEGSAGADTLIGGGGTDSVTFIDSPAAVTINLANPAANTGDAAGDVYIGISAFAGSPFGDTMIGDGSVNMFAGGGGNDTIDGGAGADTAFYVGTRSSATVTHDAVNHTLLVSTPADGADTTQRIEQFQFSDGLFSFVFKGAGPAIVANFNPANGWASQDQYPRHLADMNGDGFVDIVGFGQAGVLVSYGSANGSLSAPGVVLADFGQASGWTTDNQFHRELADVNGDGKADIIGFSYAGTLVSLAKADGSYGSPVTSLADFGIDQGWTSQNGFARTIGDVNGDGKADIIGFGYAGALVSLGNGDGTFTPVQIGIANFGVTQGWTSDNAYHRAVADVNGDGKADIIGFGVAGTYVALSRGDGTFADAKLVLDDFVGNQGWTTNDSFHRIVTDVNHDGKADIVGFGVAGTLVAFGNGDGTFTAASLDVADFGKNQGWTSDNLYHHEIADINHDGLADLVGFGVAGVLLGQNQGDFLI